MQKENKADNKTLIKKVELARDTLNEILIDLSDATSGKAHATVKLSPSAPRTSVTSIDFSIPLRAFVKRHAAGMNGAKKFVMLLAYLAKGNLDKAIELADLEREWKRMTAKNLLAVKFNRLYSSEARENDWVHTEKAGSYKLRPSWKSVFE